GHRGGEEPAVHRVLRAGGRPRHRHPLPRRDRAGRTLPPRAGPLAAAPLRHHAGSAGAGEPGGRAHARAGRGAASGCPPDGRHPPRARLLMDADPSLAEFRREVSKPDPDIDLARAALVLARSEYPDLEVEAYLARLSALAEGATPTRRTADPLER